MIDTTLVDQARHAVATVKSSNAMTVPPYDATAAGMGNQITDLPPGLVDQLSSAMQGDPRDADDRQPLSLTFNQLLKLLSTLTGKDGKEEIKLLRQENAQLKQLLGLPTSQSGGAGGAGGLSGGELNSAAIPPYNGSGGQASPAGMKMGMPVRSGVVESPISIVTSLLRRAGR